MLRKDVEDTNTIHIEVLVRKLHKTRSCTRLHNEEEKTSELGNTAINIAQNKTLKWKKWHINELWHKLKHAS
jgi:hypothetical protein